MEQEEKYLAVKDYVDHPGKNKNRIAARFSVTRRTVNRWIANYRKFGKLSFIHGNATLEPDCKIPEETRKKVVELYGLTSMKCSAFMKYCLKYWNFGAVICLPRSSREKTEAHHKGADDTIISLAVHGRRHFDP